MLHDLFPDGRFAAPATESQIAAAELELGVRLPEQLRRLYLVCDGFREGQGNAKYLLSLFDEDHIGSLVGMTRFFWKQAGPPDLTPFVIFGSSSGDENWGIRWQGSEEIVAWHYQMGHEYEIVGKDILEVYRKDYLKYDDLTGGP